MAEKITGGIEEEEQQLASALSNSVENLTLESQGDSNNSNNEQQTSIAVEEIQPTIPLPPIEVATLATPEVVDDVPLPLPPPQFDGSPTQKNDPQKRRNSYDYVESRLHQTTAATNSGKWQGKSSLSPQPTRNHIKQPLSTPDPSDLQNNHVYETPTAPSNGTTSSHFKDIPSRLHETTVATSNGKWAKPSNGPADDLPKFNTSVRRASMGELMLPQEKEKATWKDPYKDSVQSRLFSPTIATTQGQWDHTHSAASAAGSEATPTDTPQSPNEKAKRRFSTSYIPSDTIPSHDLPSSGKSSPYGNVKTRLHLQTAAVKNAKWQNDKAIESQSPEGPRFVSTFGKKTTEFPSPAPSTPNSMHNEYKDVKTRLYEATAATEHAKYNGPEVSVDSSLPKFDTSVRRASMTSSDFSTPPPVPESRKYKDVPSRLLAPTTASKEGGWKKEDVSPSFSPFSLLALTIFSSISCLVIGEEVTVTRNTYSTLLLNSSNSPSQTNRLLSSSRMACFSYNPSSVHWSASAHQVQGL
jgi:hypothetical protein